MQALYVGGDRGSGAVTPEHTFHQSYSGLILSEEIDPCKLAIVDFFFSLLKYYLDISLKHLFFPFPLHA